jgi:hypothetical protein
VAASIIARNERVSRVHSKRIIHANCDVMFWTTTGTGGRMGTSDKWDLAFDSCLEDLVLHCAKGTLNS